MPIITRGCTKCRKSFPATAEFFYVRRETVGGKQYEYFRRECRECWQAQTHKNYVPHVRQPKPKEEFRTCVKCQRSLPATREFFHYAKTFSARMGKTYDGLRGECLNCSKEVRRDKYASSDEIKRRVYESGKRRRMRPEVREQNRIASRERKREERTTPEGRARQVSYLAARRALKKEQLRRGSSYPKSNRST